MCPPPSRSVYVAELGVTGDETLLDDVALYVKELIELRLKCDSISDYSE